MSKCSHFQTLKNAEQLLKKFGVARPGALGEYDIWPRHDTIVIKSSPVRIRKAPPENSRSSE